MGGTKDTPGFPKGGRAGVKQLSRFLRLERVRKDSQHEVPAPLSRFSTLEEARSEVSTATHCAPGLERFTPESAELELEAPDNSEPFIRCPHCGADSVRHAAVCRQCERRLDSEEVQAFNVRLWATMTAARDVEARELREREALRLSPPSVNELSVEEMVAREHARRALETPSAWASMSRWGQSSGGVSRGWTFLAVSVLGLPLFLGLLRRGVSGAAFLVAVGVLAMLATWKRR
jgi:hypothetical protein